MDRQTKLFYHLMMAWLKTPMNSPAFDHIEEAKDLFKQTHAEQRSQHLSDEDAIITAPACAVSATASKGV